MRQKMVAVGVRWMLLFLAGYFLSTVVQGAIRREMVKAIRSIKRDLREAKGTREGLK